MMSSDIIFSSGEVAQWLQRIFGKDVCESTRGFESRLLRTSLFELLSGTAAKKDRIAYAKYFGDGRF